MKKLALVVLVILLSASFAYAAEYQCCKNIESKDMTRLYGARLCNGLSNGILGWSEIFFRPGKVVAEGGNPIVGVFRGLGNAVARTAGGVVEVATFWTPGESVVKMKDCPLCAYK